MPLAWAYGYAFTIPLPTSTIDHSDGDLLALDTLHPHNSDRLLLRQRSADREPTLPQEHA